MTQVYQPPNFFVKGPSPLARLTFFGLLSIALMFIDQRYNVLETVRAGIATVTYPLQQAALWPALGLRSVGAFFETRTELRSQNESLRKAALENSQAVQGWKASQDENAQLRALLKAEIPSERTKRVTTVLYTSRAPDVQKLHISSGRDHGLRPGQAVIDGKGLIGQVTRVHPLLSEVTLITERDVTVPVKVERTGVRMLLYGNGGGKLPELRYAPANSDLKLGDVLLTSGLEGVYPPNLAVAKIVKIERGAPEAQPLAGVDSSSEVLVVGLGADAPELPAPAEALGTKPSRRRGP